MNHVISTCKVAIGWLVDSNATLAVAICSASSPYRYPAGSDTVVGEGTMQETAPRHGIRELAALTGTTVRTMRRWVNSGAVSATDFRGPATSYGARHVDEARAVKRLLAENLTLEAIRARLGTMSDDALARFVRPEAIAVEAGAVASAAPTPVAPALEPERSGSDAIPGLGGERWEHVTLLPGLKLLVHGDSGALVLRIAREIHERYGATKP